MKRDPSLDRRRASRPGTPDPVELRVVLEAQRVELRSLLGPAIRLEIGALPTERSTVARARRSEIVDLFRHVALDARDAMPAGGALTILAGSLWICGAEPAVCAAVVIRETPEVQAPQETGRFRKGRGLGLGAACSVIENTGGHLLFSCRGRESVTTICFPLAP